MKIIKIAGGVMVLAVALAGMSAAAGEMIGKVVEVKDGDNIVVQSQGKKRVVRVFGIDAPEIDQPWGTEAKVALRDKLVKKQVKVVWNDKCKTDAAGRIVGRVTLGEEEVAEWMLKEGHAWCDLSSSQPETMRWRELEKAAKESQTGLWGKAGPVQPAKWRALRK